MKDNKFKMFYQFVDVYKDNYIISDEYDDNEKLQLYEIFDPIEFGLLIKYIDLLLIKYMVKIQKKMHEK